MTTYHLAPDGNDAHDGALDAPWARIEHALLKMSPGDTLLLRGGVYNSGEVWLKDNRYGGSADAFKTLKAYPGEVPSLGGDRRVICRAPYLRWEGLHFRLPYRMEISGPGYVHVVGCTFAGGQPRFGALEVFGDGLLLEGNTIAVDDSGGDTRDHGIYIHRSTNMIVRHNTITGVKGYGLHVYDEPKSAGDTGSIRNLRLEGNLVKACQTRSGIVINAREGFDIDNVTIANNVLMHNNFQGILLERCSNVNILNNTFVDNGRNGLLVGDGAQNVAVKNNIFAMQENAHCVEKCSWYDFQHIILAASVTTATFAKNLFSPLTTAVGISEAINNQPLFADPQFVDAANENFHLQAGSPAIDMGAQVPLDRDRDGNARPKGHHYDLGAYEFGGVPAPTPPPDPVPVPEPEPQPQPEPEPTPDPLPLAARVREIEAVLFRVEAVLKAWREELEESERVP